MKHPVLGLFGWFGVTFAAAAVGALGSSDAPEFYAQLMRPPWAPPAWWFGPVWSTLYSLMAVAAWLVWRARGFAGARAALILFFVQLAANALWSWLFFRLRRGDLALVEVVALWCLVVDTVLAFQRVSRMAGALLYPYLAWITFAAALTFGVWRLNPQLLS